MLYIRSIVPEPDPADGLISRVCMAKYLLGLMAEDFSETCHFVSWADDLPFVFWQAALGNEVEGAFGTVALSPEVRDLVMQLATVADGWWTGSPSHDMQGDAFMPLVEWRKRVSERTRSK
jgi:hypothetical protein